MTDGAEQDTGAGKPVGYSRGTAWTGRRGWFGRRERLASKVFAVSFPVIAGIVLVTLLGLGILNYRARYAELRERTETLVEITALSLTNQLWNFDRLAYARQIRALQRDPAFVFARLTGQYGEVLSVVGTQPAAEAAGVVAGTVPIHAPDGSEVIGRLDLYLSTAGLRAEAWRQVRIGLAAFALLVVGLSLTLQIGVRRMVQRPLADLLAAMQSVERKRWETVSVTGRDEIARLSEGFNHMVRGLRAGDEAKRLLAELAAANRQIHESIQYASRIQTAVLPDLSALGDAVRELDVLWEPLESVGGDFYWLERFDHRSLLLVADCTGHGVPGAFMTLVAASALDHHLRAHGLGPPGALLLALDAAVRKRLKQDERVSPDQIEQASDDGFEAAACIWDERARTLCFAGAGLSLFHTETGSLQEVRGTRTMLGYRSVLPRTPLAERTITVARGESFYLFSDGVPHLMGGTPPRLLGRRGLADLLRQHQHRPIADQLTHLRSALTAWRGTEPVRDDMTLLAVRP